MTELRAPNCPECGEPPRMVMDVQAFCGNEDCQAFSWDITSDPATFRETAQIVHIHPAFDLRPEPE